jgi:ribosomal protein L35
VIDTTVEAKLKTRKAAAKRYKITGSGKVMCRRAGKQHLNEKMSRKQNTRLSNEKAVFAGDVCFTPKHHLLALHELTVLLWWILIAAGRPAEWCRLTCCTSFMKPK